MAATPQIAIAVLISVSERSFAIRVRYTTKTTVLFNF